MLARMLSRGCATTGVAPVCSGLRPHCGQSSAGSAGADAARATQARYPKRVVPIGYRPFGKKTRIRPIAPAIAAA